MSGQSLFYGMPEYGLYLAGLIHWIFRGISVYAFPALTAELILRYGTAWFSGQTWLAEVGA